MQKTKSSSKSFFTALAIFIGTCVGVGFLGIPYVAAQAGFFVSVFYIIILGLILLYINLCIGEVCLRTKSEHQLIGYTGIYLGKFGRALMIVAFMFGMYSALIAYMTGVGESLSFLIFGNFNFTLILGIIFGFVLSFFLFGGMRNFKRYEKIAVSFVLAILFLAFFIFIWKVNPQNLLTFNSQKILLPFGVILFSLLAFSSIPNIRIALRNNESLMKKTLVWGMSAVVFIYVIFTLVIVGFLGDKTPEISTMALGGFFILLSIFTMSVAHFSLGMALKENFILDFKFRNLNAWLFSAILPILLFVFIQFLGIKSFIGILSIAGVISGGLNAILVLLMVREAKVEGKRKPEYSMPINWFIIILLGAIFIAGIVVELVF